jgi:hypothetical protein
MMDWAQIAALSAAGGQWAVVLVTWWLVKGQLSTAKEQRNTQLFLELRKEFDRDPLSSARKVFAAHLLDDKPHDEINQQAILTFFEDMGMLCRRKCLDREMVWDTFGHFAKMWWSACRDYTAQERAKLNDDPFFFRDFEYLVEQICEDDIKQRHKTRAALEPSQSEVKAFLETEAQRPRGSNDVT